MLIATTTTTIIAMNINGMADRFATFTFTVIFINESLVC